MPSAGGIARVEAPVSDSSPCEQPRVYTIGHSNRPVEAFIDRLRSHGIAVVADVRSAPYSRFAPHFNSENLRRTLAAHGIDYLFFGRELGGLPRGSEFYDAEGHVLYARLAESKAFLDGISRLMAAIAKHRVALTCSEEDPASCHRRLLIGRVLTERGVHVEHIFADGSVKSEEALAAQESAGGTGPRQKTLFDIEVEPEWKSTRSVSARRAPKTSSPH